MVLVVKPSVVEGVFIFAVKMARLRRSAEDGVWGVWFSGWSGLFGEGVGRGAPLD